jgi:GNAT superfamily N-acetyltransferase
VLDLRPVALDHPDALKLDDEVQAYYREIYGDEGDSTSMRVADFTAPSGLYLIGYLDGVAVASGGWRSRDRADDPRLSDGDAEMKRVYVSKVVRGRGFARAVLAALESDAFAAGRRRMVLETGTLQTDAVALYESSGYAPIPNFGYYAEHELSRCYAKPLLPLR